MTSNTITPVEKGIRCKHTGVFSLEDVRSLASFFHDYRGKLLVDLSETTAEECAKHIRNLRPKKPTTAIFGAELDISILDSPDSYDTHEIRHFATEKEALTWFREQ